MTDLDIGGFEICKSPIIFLVLSKSLHTQFVFGSQPLTTTQMKAILQTLDLPLLGLTHSGLPTCILTMIYMYKKFILKVNLVI